jgi:hypothetical protein
MYIFIFFKFPALKLAHKLSGETEGKLRNTFSERF